MSEPGHVAPASPFMKKGVRIFKTQVVQESTERTLQNGMIVRILQPVKKRVEVFKEKKKLNEIQSEKSSSNSTSEKLLQPQTIPTPD